MGGAGGARGYHSPSPPRLNFFLMPKTQSWGTAPYGPDDPEFEARVRSAIGGPYLGAVDKSRATRLPGSYAGLLGLYTVPGISQEYLLEESPNRNRYRSLQANGVPVEADRVYAGDIDATTQTWAHEFRHRANPSSMSELTNRLMDAYYAGSKPQWDEAVRMWAEWNKLSLDVAEADLVKELQKEEMGFTSMPEFSEEWKAGKVNDLASWGPRQAFRGLLSPEKADAAEKVNAPWKLWASKGLLSE